MAAPSKLTSEIQTICVEVIRAGGYLEEAATRAGVSITSVRRWLSRGQREKHGPFHAFWVAIEGAKEEAIGGTISDQHRRAAELGDSASLTRTQERVLRLLEHDGIQPSVSEIARQLGSSISMLLDVVRRLESHGLVKRLVDPGSRRSTPIRITAYGQAVLATSATSQEDPDEVARVGHARRTLRENYFAGGLTMTNGYDFGFLLADGSMDRKRYAIHVELAESEQLFLEAMRDRFGSDAPIRVREKTINGKTYRTATLIFSSARLCSDLFALGFRPNKDFRDDYELPDVHGAVAAEVIRGLFDGDGTIVEVLTRNPHGAKLVINNRQRTLDWAATIIRRETGIEGTVRLISTRGTYAYEVIAHADVVRLAHWLYAAPGSYLSRKRDKLYSLLDERNQALAQRQAEQDARAQEVIRRYGAGMEMAEISELTHVPIGVVARIVNRHGLHHRKPYKTPNLYDLRDVHVLRMAGSNPSEIAYLTGFSLATVRKLLADPTAAAKLEAKWQRNREIRALREQGILIKDIAARLGISRNTVMAALKSD